MLLAWLGRACSNSNHLQRKYAILWEQLTLSLLYLPVFEMNHYPDCFQRETLAQHIHLTEFRVQVSVPFWLSYFLSINTIMFSFTHLKVWFQNRRAKNRLYEWDMQAKVEGQLNSVAYGMDKLVLNNMMHEQTRKNPAFFLAQFYILGLKMRREKQTNWMAYFCIFSFNQRWHC
jgi:hypothetical protein